MNIKQVPAHSNNYSKGRSGQQITKIILHWIVGNLERADTLFKDSERLASAHYAIGDSEVHQYVDEGNVAWHAGNWKTNLESVGIEHAGGWLLDDGKARMKPSDKTHKTSARLVAEICTRYNIPCDRIHILKHKEVSVKNTQCPGSLDVDKIVADAKKILGKRNYLIKD